MAKKEAKKENIKNKKSYFKDFKAELKKVIWPTPKQLVNNTVAVVTVVLITAAIVFVLDLCFETLNKQGFNKIRELVVTTESVSDEENEIDTQTSEDNSENTATEGETEATPSEENVEVTENTEATEQNAEGTTTTETQNVVE